MGSQKEIAHLMMRWEFQFKRDRLVDCILVLKAACAAAPSSDELLILLQTLYYEQACKMRPVFKNKTKQGFDAVHVMRGLMLRHTFYNYCRQVLPPSLPSTRVHEQGCAPQPWALPPLMLPSTPVRGQGCTPQPCTALPSRHEQAQGCTPQPWKKKLEAFPNHMDAIRKFGTWEWYFERYGMQENGRIDPKDEKEPEDRRAEEGQTLCA